MITSLSVLDVPFRK